MQSLQDTYGPNSVCFGCGPKNGSGLRIKSRPEGTDVVCDWTPSPDHHAFEGFVSGGIISTLLDCHGNWTAIHTLIEGGHLQTPPSTVTSELIIRFLRPTPMGPLKIRARPTRVEGERVSVTGEIYSGDKPTASMKGVYVAVKEGHPAFHRWD